MTNELSRREMMVGAGAAATLGLLSTYLGSEAVAAQAKEPPGVFMHKLPKLRYPYDALEPVIDKKTVEIHHNKHFAGYVKGLNKSLEQLAEARKKMDFKGMHCLADALAFNGSGVVLHWIYFDTIGPNAGGKPDG